MISVRGENHRFELYKRIKNSPYMYDSVPELTFHGRPAGNAEKKLYRIMAGIQGSDTSVFVISSNLPKQVEVEDKIRFLGKEWTVQSVGYYFDESLIVNPSVMSDQEIIKRLPKGIVIS